MIKSPCANSSFYIADLVLSELRLVDNQNLVWLLIIPKKENAVEILDLSADEQIILLQEINLVAKLMKTNFDCDKLNIASFGNKVPNLHVHIIARRKNDFYFPETPFDKPGKSYLTDEKTTLIKKIRDLLDDASFGS